MAPNTAPTDLEFLISCIKNGELKIDYKKVNDEYGWTGRSKSQLKYKSILKNHGLAITGKERYTKIVAADDNNDDDDDDGSAAPTTPSKRKAAKKPAEAPKSSKRAKKADDDEAATAADDIVGKKKKTVGEAPVKDETEAEDGEDGEDDEA